MRRVFASNLSSLDGFFEGPDKKLDWFVPDEEFFDYALAMLRSVDTILFGRDTYLHMVAYWPTAPAHEIADKMNNLPKIVFSKSLPSADWRNSTLVRGDAAAEVGRLKKLPGCDMVILGSAALTSSLLQAGLIDEYRIILAPIVIGLGNPLFPNMRQRLKLKLSKVQPLASGVVILYYECH